MVIEPYSIIMTVTLLGLLTYIFIYLFTLLESDLHF